MTPYYVSSVSILFNYGRHCCGDTVQTDVYYVCTAGLGQNNRNSVTPRQLMSLALSLHVREGKDDKRHSNQRSSPFSSLPGPTRRRRANVRQLSTFLFFPLLQQLRLPYITLYAVQKEWAKLKDPLKEAKRELRAKLFFFWLDFIIMKLPSF